MLPFPPSPPSRSEEKIWGATKKGGSIQHFSAGHGCLLRNTIAPFITGTSRRIASTGHVGKPNNCLKPGHQACGSRTVDIKAPYSAIKVTVTAGSSPPPSGVRDQVPLIPTISIPKEPFLCQNPRLTLRSVPKIFKARWVPTELAVQMVNHPSSLLAPEGAGEEGTDETGLSEWGWTILGFSHWLTLGHATSTGQDSTFKKQASKQNPLCYCSP